MPPKQQRKQKQKQRASAAASSGPAASAQTSSRQATPKKSKSSAKSMSKKDEEALRLKAQAALDAANQSDAEESGDDSDDEHDDQGEDIAASVVAPSAGGKRSKAQQEDGEDSDEDEDEDEDEDQEEDDFGGQLHPKLARLITAAQEKKSPRWTNRQRTLVMASRGISFRVRHLIQDLRGLMPHSKKDAKMDRKDRINDILPEICEMRNCNNCVYIEMRKKRDVYMWLSKMPHGPSVKFAVHNIHTLDELKLTGNCLKGSRPLVQFSDDFEKTPHHRLMKELLYQTFAVPNQHPKSKPFVDHIISFFLLDGHIWFRCYQTSWKPKGKLGKDQKTTLVEIGPRFVLEPIRVFEGTFGGPTLYQNTEYSKKAIPPKYKQQPLKE